MLNKLSRQYRQRDIVFVLLALLGLLVFVPNLRSYFLADDFVLLSWTSPAHVSSLTDILGFFDPHTFWFYRPVVKLYYWAVQLPFGLQAAPFHAISLLVHAANGYLVYRLVIRQDGTRWVTALAAGLLFLLNVHHAETVSWIAAIGDLIGTFCVLASLICFQRYCESLRTWYLFFSLALFAIGLFARETVVILPVLLLLDAVIFDRTKQLGVRRLLAISGAYLAILLFYLTIQATARGAGTGPLARGGLQFHALSLESVLLGVMAFVHGLIPGGNLIAQLPLDTLRIVVWVELALVLALAFTLWRTGQRMMLFGLAWMLVTPLVFIFYNTPTERYYYLPSIGYAILVAAFLTGLPQFAQSWHLPQAIPATRVATVLVLAILILWQSIGLVTHVSDWERAGSASGGVFGDIQRIVPGPRDYSAFYLVNLPMNINGVPTFQNSLPQAIQLMYDNDTINASAVTCAYLQQQSELPRYNFIFRYDGDGVEQLANEKQCR